ncbi:RecX family transcriptional regulator [Curtobacterium sp. MCPF17_052]|nr:RecX family transcriptional regulator [Curtobacterium sp. MCPF17_052]WIB12224.1 RecX family transcriptional regulator [Curtobacterium sp. MCPF17_052]
MPLPIRGAQSEWLSPVVGDGSGRTTRDEQSGYDGEEADAPTASVFSITGGEIDPADAPRPLDEQRADAERISMRALSRRGVSTSELRTMLVKQDEFDPDVIEHEIERLTRVGLLDDIALATDLVDRMHSRKGLGRQAIVADLRRRGDRPGRHRRRPRSGRRRRGRRVRPGPRAGCQACRTDARPRPCDRRTPAVRVPDAQRLQRWCRPRRRRACPGRTATSDDRGRDRPLRVTDE